MKRCVVVILAFVGAVVAQARDVAWGASSNGLSLGISSAPGGKALELHFRNDTPDALYIVTGDLWWHCDLHLDGKRITREDDTKDLMLPPPTAGSFTRIAPGAIYIESVPLSRWRAPWPGEVTLAYTNVATDGKAFGFNVWKGTVLSGSHEIKAALAVPGRPKSRRNT